MIMLEMDSQTSDLLMLVPRTGNTEIGGRTQKQAHDNPKGIDWRVPDDLLSNYWSSSSSSGRHRDWNWLQRALSIRVQDISLNLSSEKKSPHCQARFVKTDMELYLS